MLDLYAFSEAHRLEMSDLNRRLSRRAGWVEHCRWDRRDSTEDDRGRAARVLVNDPWSLEQMVRIVGEQRRAEAEWHRLAVVARGPRRSVRIVVAQALRALASRLDGVCTRAARRPASRRRLTLWPWLQGGQG
jgi:hypothetical protein